MSFPQSYRDGVGWPNAGPTQTRGRNPGQSYRDSFPAQGGFDNGFQQPPRRSRSADSRPQYNNRRTDFFESPSKTSYREDNGFPNFFSQADSNRVNSDVGGFNTSMDSFRHSQLPKYEAVVHDDSMLYSNNERRRYRGNAEEDFLVLSNNAPTRSSPTPGQAAYNFGSKNRDDRIDFVDRRPSNGLRQHQQGQLNTSQEQYYTFAKENLITFGDAPSASTGLSQEELLQRRQREEARNKKTQKRKNKIKDRIINFSSSLRRSQSPQRNQYSTQQKRQQQPPPPSQSSNYHKMSTPESNIFNGNDNMPNPSGYQNRGRGTRGPMVQRHKGKFKKSNTFKSQAWNESGETNGDANGFREDPIGNRLGNTYSANHDYLLVHKSPPRTGSTTGRGRGGSARPLYADFTPRSDSFKLQPYSMKDPSPTSVMDDFTASGGVRWNKNLTQQEVITTPQSTKLRPDSGWNPSAGKPKSILRGRHSSSHVPKGQSRGDMEMNYGFDQNGQRQVQGNRAHGFDDGFAPDFGPDGFVDNRGRDLSPIGFDRQANDINTKFPESYIQFVEAVAAVVIQTKVRQRLAKKQVEAMRNQRYANRNSYGYSQATTAPMTRKPYALAKKARQATQTKAPRGRKDVALDFYSLAAIQIQAAFRGWWVRDCIGVDNFCATMIQKTYRGYRCRKEYHQIIDDEVTRAYGSVRIQAAVRGALVRRERVHDPMQPYHDAATKIQTFWRSFVCEMNFLRAYEDILVVQSIARGWIARRRVLSLLEAKNNKFSNRRKPSARFKSSRLSSSTPRNVGAYSNNSGGYQNSWMAKSTSKPQTSVPQPSVVKKPNVARPVNSHMPWKVASNSSKGIQNTRETVSNPKPNSLRPNNVVETTKVETQPAMNFAQEIASSTSRDDIERRRKLKEEEHKREQEKEKRRLEAQAAGLAELELARKRMAMKASKREEKQRNEQEENEAKPTEQPKANSSDYFAQVRNTQNKPSPVATTRSFQKESISSNKSSSVEPSKVEAKQIEETQNLISPADSGGEKSSVAERRKALFGSNGGGPSSAPKRNFSIAKPSEKADSKKEVSPPPVAPEIQYGDVPKRDLVTESSYQKEMQKLRSESEQKRIDYMHHIFDQAGLLSRTK